MTDETGDNTPDAPTPDPEWASPPAWGSSTWGAPPTAPTPTTPPPTTPAWGAPPAQPYPQPYAQPYTQPQPQPQSWPPAAPPAAPPPYPPAGAGAGGGGWNYGYGGLWSPPPEAPRAAPNRTRRAIAAIAVVVLVLVSGALGALFSAAVHNDPAAAPVAQPFTGGTNGNGSNGSNNGLGSPGNNTTGDTSAIAAKVSPALVNIYTTIKTPSGSGQAAGTGMIISKSGEVLTNNHVIADSSAIRVEIVATGETESATVVGYDVKDDVALLQIDDVSDLQTVSFSDAAKVAVGDSVVAIGNAGGRGGEPAVTSGSVTALDQKVTAGDGTSGDSETLLGMIEISAPIEPGDSGGPLVNTDGKVVGMNTAAASSDAFSGQAGSTTAFAIPINRALRLVEQIRNGEESANVHIGERGLLGVRVQDIDTQADCPATTNSGALVAGAEDPSPANSAGLGACDVIVSIDGKNVASTSDLNEAMFPYHPEDKVQVGWVDENGESHTSELTLIAGPPA